MARGSPHPATTLDAESGQSMAVSPPAASGLVGSRVAQGAVLRLGLPQRVGIAPLGGDMFLPMKAGGGQRISHVEGENPIMTDCNCTNFPAGLGNVTFGASVGIGTSSPEAPLHVVGTLLVAGLNARLTLGRDDGTDPASAKTWQLDNNGNDLRLYQQPTLNTSGTVYLVVKDGGNVGIGTQNPTALLSVAGTISYASGASGAVGLVDNDNHAIRSNGLGSQVFANGWGHAAQGWIFRDDANGADRVIITSAGTVGIGTESPAYPLDVAGTVRTTGVLLGGDQLMSGALKDSTGTRTNVDAAGCYYAG